MDQELKSNILSGKHWLRFLFMVFFIVCLQVSRVVVLAVVALQFLFSLVTGEDNRKLRAFGKSLTTYISQALTFLTYNSNDKPFPFADWPKVELDVPIEGELVTEETVVESDNAEDVKDDQKEDELETEK